MIIRSVNEDENKYVSEADLYKEFEKINSQAKKYSGIKVELIDPHLLRVKLGMILPGIGTVGTLSAEDTEKYGKDILKVAELIRKFKYNGYMRGHK